MSWFFRSFDIPLADVVGKVEEYLYHPKTKFVSETSENVTAALKILRDEKLNLSGYNDKVVLSSTINFGALATFDKRLRKQAVDFRIQVLPERI